ncbi:MAG TPA: TolC family protein, partial [Burkholderiales bacterium]
MKRHGWIVLTALALSGCATTSAMLEPNVDVPAAYRADVAGDVVPLTTDWWRTFDSAELAALIDLALRDSPDLAIAMERVRQAEALVRIAGASLFPQLDLGLSTSRRKVDNDNASSAVTTEGTSATLSASYEVDVWGRNASDRRASEALLDASRFDRESVRLTTVSGVANAYFQVLSLRGRLQVARENLAIAERVLDIVNVRARNGVVSQLDVARQNNAVLSQRAAIPPLELQERQSLAALAILTGRTPQSF